LILPFNSNLSLVLFFIVFTYQFVDWTLSMEGELLIWRQSELQA